MQKGSFSFINKINRLRDVAVTDNSTNTESVAMFIDDTTLSEILNVANHESNQPIATQLQFYCSVIRSTFEYGDVLWHEGLTNS